MGFIQIVEYRTSRFDEIQKLSEEFRAANAGFAGGPKQIRVAVDRDSPGTYRTIVEFESYENAMENSARPETNEFAEKMSKLVDGPPTFYNLDVVAEY